MIMLMLASIGTFLSVGLKLPYFYMVWQGFWLKAKGAAPQYEERLQWVLPVQPYATSSAYIENSFLIYASQPCALGTPYCIAHLSEILQLMAFTGLGFLILLKKMKPEPLFLNLDTDWFL